MDIQDKEFFKELISMFKMETAEHIAAIHGGLETILAKSSPGERQKTIEEVHRAAHSLKGAARTVGLLEIETAGKHLEKLFLLLKNGQVELTKKMAETFHECTDTLERLIETMNDEGAVNGSAVEVIHRLEAVEQALNS
ncbi:Hpt domain-containing protein [bacterium]|nr:Hpt domain-containing protein [bacterium]